MFKLYNLRLIQLADMFMCGLETVHEPVLVTKARICLKSFLPYERHVLTC